MKHIAVVLPDFPIPSETFVVTEIKSLLKMGHKITVFCFNRELHWIELPDKVNVIELDSTISNEIGGLFRFNPMNLVKSFICAYHLQEISIKSLLFYGVKLATLAKKYGCEHFHCHFLHNVMAYVLVAAKLADVTVSGVGHGHDVDVNSHDLKYKLQMCNFCIAVCQDMNNTFSLLGAKHHYLLHSGVDVSHFALNPPPDHNNVRNRRLRLLFVGRLVAKKGLKYALEALAKIDAEHRPCLDIVGKGPEYARISEQIKQLHLEEFVCLLGHHTPNWIAQVSGQYDAFIAPFYTPENGETNTSHLAVKEAMAMGLPVITCETTGCREVVSYEVGFIVKPKDTNELKEAIESLNYLKPSIRQKMGILARKRVEVMFDSITQAKKLSNLIEQIHS
ncbi:glycosyltransferase [Pseudoalteromonas denitrificans]|uniref:Glycosyltransferase involved in cell wall bisynthesis n=1 Tax=Pseudoalteromonas denitrificans DSM 6059 TaxID=1123010 RepID=A0A1I1ET85_9GAMM|nr:glycosyltransferase [Pseudoalteromonas denitrificans]SFB88738.1 Glycosyltransferase involved in cell wall bisynthesis [Pseudoalteromonas denitrificans DSM 6059]